MNLPGFYKNKKNRGQATVELALAFPIFMLLVFGVFEGGRLFFIYTSIAAAGREAARYAAGIGQIATSSPALYNDCNGIRDAAIRIGSLAGIKASDITIFHDTGPGTTAAPYCGPGDSPITIALNDRIVVRTATVYNPIVPLIPFPPMILRSENAHTLIKEAPVIAYTPQVVSVADKCDNTGLNIDIQAPLGPVVTVTLTNTSSKNRTINDFIVVWDPTSSPYLEQIDGVIISPSFAPPYYSKDVDWPFNIGEPKTFNLVFSRQLKNNVIVRLTVDKISPETIDCTFGK